MTQFINYIRYVNVRRYDRNDFITTTRFFMYYKLIQILKFIQKIHSIKTFTHSLLGRGTTDVGLCSLAVVDHRQYWELLVALQADQNSKSPKSKLCRHESC